MENLDRWRNPNLDAFFDGDIVGQMAVNIGPDALLHSLLLADGMLFDLAAKFEFRYPEELEKTVRQSWSTFKDECDPSDG